MCLLVLPAQGWDVRDLCSCVKHKSSGGGHILSVCPFDNYEVFQNQKTGNPGIGTSFRRIMDSW